MSMSQGIPFWESVLFTHYTVSCPPPLPAMVLLLNAKPEWAPRSTLYLSGIYIGHCPLAWSLTQLAPLQREILAPSIQNSTNSFSFISPYTLNTFVYCPHFSVTEGQDLFSAHCPEFHVQNMFHWLGEKVSRKRLHRETASALHSCQAQLHSQRPNARRQDFLGGARKSFRCEPEVPLRAAAAVG